MVCKRPWTLAVALRRTKTPWPKDPRLRGNIASLVNFLTTFHPPPTHISPHHWNDAKYGDSKDEIRRMPSKGLVSSVEYRTVNQP